MISNRWERNCVLTTQTSPENYLNSEQISIIITNTIIIFIINIIITIIIGCRSANKLFQLERAYLLLPESLEIHQRLTWHCNVGN